MLGRAGTADSPRESDGEPGERQMRKKGRRKFALIYGAYGFSLTT